MAPTYKKIIKITFLIYKKPGLSAEEFAKHYIEHGSRTVQIMQKNRVLGYTQQLATAEAADRLRATVTPRAADSMLDCAGIATITFPDWESVEGFFKDQENMNLKRGDGPVFSDPKRRGMVVGDEIVFLEDGVAL